MRILLTMLFLLLPPSWATGATITDHARVDIGFRKPFTRIISLYAAHTENLFELGLDKEIIGVSRSEDFPAAALDKPVFNPRDGVERFLAAAPDLVLIRPMHRRGYPALWTGLEKAGITVVTLQPGSIEEMYGYWEVLGKLTGRHEQAQAMVAWFQVQLATQRQKLGAIPQDRRPRVFFESIHRKLSTFSRGSMAQLVLAAAGGRNVAQDAEPRHGTNIAGYGKERILSKAREIDVYLAQTGTMNRVSIDAIKKEPGFAAIKAVQSGRVHLIDEELVSRPTTRLIQGIRILHNMLYPHSP